MSERYDAGYLNDHGGGNVGWWWDYMRAEIERANDFHAEIHERQYAEIERLTTENAELRSGEYLVKVVEERERLRRALEKIDREDDTGPLEYEHTSDGNFQVLGRGKGEFSAIARAVLCGDDNA